MRTGEKLYSSLLAPILTVTTPVSIGFDAIKIPGHRCGNPEGPPTVDGGGGGHKGPNCPFKENAHTASPYALPCNWLPPVAMATYCSPSTSYTTGGASAPKPVWNRQSSCPVLASIARKLPSGSPRKTRPAAVTVAPPPPPMRYGVLCCHAILVVLLAMAVNVPRNGEPIGIE